MLSQLMKLYVYAIAVCVVFAATITVIYQFQVVLPWVVVLAVLVIVGRVVWTRTYY